MLLYAIVWRTILELLLAGAFMSAEQIELFETAGLYLCLSVLFFLMGMSIQDVLKKSNVPMFGRIVVWVVLCFGCAGFILKGLIQLGWNAQG